MAKADGAPERPNRPRIGEISFRTLMLVGVHGSLLAMVVAGFVSQWAVSTVSEHAVSERQRHVRLARGSDDVMQHMLNE